MKKYEFTGEQNGTGITAEYRIRYIRDIITPYINVKAGTIGGWVSSEDNLSHDGNCVILDNASALMQSKVRDDSIISGNAVVDFKAEVSGHSYVGDNSRVIDWAKIKNTRVSNNARVRGDAEIGNDVDENEIIQEDDFLMQQMEDINYKIIKIMDNSIIDGEVKITGSVTVKDYAVITNDTVIDTSVVGNHIKLIGGKWTFDDEMIYFSYRNDECMYLCDNTKGAEKIYIKDAVYNVNDWVINYKNILMRHFGWYGEREYNERAYLAIDPYNIIAKAHNLPKILT